MRCNVVSTRRLKMRKLVPRILCHHLTPSRKQMFHETRCVVMVMSKVVITTSSINIIQDRYPFLTSNVDDYVFPRFVAYPPICHYRTA
jgi:hypothetical protein